MRYDLITSVRPLRPAFAKSERALFTYSDALNDPFAEIAQLINKGISAESLFGSFLSKAGAATAAKQDIPDLPSPNTITKLGHGAQTMPGVGSVTGYEPTRIGPSFSTQETHAAPAPGSAPLQSSSTRQQWTPGHMKAANDALAAHHLHEHYRVLSNQGPAAAQQAGHMQQHLKHAMASESLAKQGVEATPQHHQDLMEHYRSPQAEVGGGPVETGGVSPTHAWAAHQSLSGIGGHGVPVGTSQTGLVQRPTGSIPTSSKKTPSLTSIPTSRSAVMDLKPQPALVPHAKEVAPDFTTGQHTRADLPTMTSEPKTNPGIPSKMGKALTDINALLKSAADLQKDYGYGGEEEKKDLSKWQTPNLRSLFPEHRQEQRLTQDRKAKKQKQVEQSFQVEKSLRLLDAMLLIS